MLTALSLALLGIGQAFGGQQGMTIALGIAVVMNGISYFFSDKIALAMSGAKPVTREQSPRLYAIVERLCGKANLPMPRLHLIPEAAPNAFATGRNPEHASVAVTAGLLELMTEGEVEGVLAHELAHVKNYDILTASVAATIAATIVHVARLGLWFGGSRDDRQGSGIGALLMLILAPIGALVIQLAISRTREFAADAGAAQMVGHPYGLISALEKLGGYNKRIPMDVHPSAAPLYIVAPLSGGGMMSWFSTHPPLEKRIATLRNMVVTR